MSIWDDRSLTATIRGILEAVEGRNTRQERPFVSGYQLAAALHRADAAAFDAIDTELGGAGIGQHHSVAQYLARELSRRAGEMNVERVFLAHQDVRFMEFTEYDGRPVRSSNVDSGLDLSLFRLRA